MATIEMYSSAFCPYCHAAQRLLESKGARYEVRSVDGDGAMRREMMSRSGHHSVPQVFIDGAHVGGFDDLAELDAGGELDRLLDSSRSANSSEPPTRE